MVLVVVMVGHSRQGGVEKLVIPAFQMRLVELSTWIVYTAFTTNALEDYI
jgi:hypothetical protein